MKTDLTQLVDFRKGKESDHPFVYSTWIKGFYFGAGIPKPKEEDETREQKESRIREMDKHRNRIATLFRNPHTEIWISCLREDADVIIGYAVYEFTEHGVILHWIYVKDHWKKEGIGKSLLAPNIYACTHLTRVGKSLKPKEWNYFPLF